jgi:iron complex transport system substrate-binding protein
MRIISLVPSITETLFALGLDDQIVAITRFCLYPEDRVKRKPKVGGTKNPKLTEIVAYHPDLVIMNVDENRKEDADLLKENGVQLYVTFPNSIPETCEMLDELGKLLNVTGRSGSMIAEIQARSDFQPPARKKTLILIWRNPYMTVAPGTYVDSMARVFGFDNVIDPQTQRYPKLGDQQIAALDPDLILFPDDPYPFRDRHVEEFKERYPQMRAVRNHRLAWFDGSYLTWFGYRTLLALRDFPVTAEKLELWK